MKHPSFCWVVFPPRRFGGLLLLWLVCQGSLTASVRAATWTQRHRDALNTGRADFAVPANRQGTNFFSAIRWQKRTPGSPNEGNLSSSAMVFFDGV